MHIFSYFLGTCGFSFPQPLRLAKTVDRSPESFDRYVWADSFAKKCNLLFVKDNLSHVMRPDKCDDLKDIIDTLV